jgi:hypothetical protein
MMKVEGTDQKAIDAVLAADTERTALLEEERKLKPLAAENSNEGLAASERLIEIYNRLKAIGAYSAEHRSPSNFTHMISYFYQMSKLNISLFVIDLVVGGTQSCSDLGWLAVFSRNDADAN